LLDADIRDFFGQLDRGWLMKFLRHRIADERVLRLVSKWLAAGVIEDGQWTESEKGSPQGASASPLLANVYLHYVLDLWADWWRNRHAHGDMVIVRFADLSGRPDKSAYADSRIMPPAWYLRWSGLLAALTDGIIRGGWSEGLEVGDEAVGRAVAAGSAAGRVHAGEGAFLDFHVGVQVGLGGFG
jgi:hypothetical protein